MITNYISDFAQLLAMLVIFLATKYLTFNITEVWGLPRWLNYKPFNCNLCLTFWTLVVIYTTLWIVGYNWLGISGLIMAALNALAMYINQRKNTESINNYHVDEE